MESVLAPACIAALMRRSESIRGLSPDILVCSMLRLLTRVRFMGLCLLQLNFEAAVAYFQCLLWRSNWPRPNAASEKQ